MRKALILVAVLAMASSAQAVMITGVAGGDIDVMIVPLGIFPSNMGPMDVYDVLLVDTGTPNDSVSAVDVDIVPNPADNLLGMSQVYLFNGGLMTPDMGSPVGVPGAATLAPADKAVDTHFNIWGAGAHTNWPQWNASTTPPAENNDFSGLATVGGGMAGYGTTLSVISAQTPIVTDLNLAQVALPVGKTALLTGSCADASGEIFTFGLPRGGAGGGIVIPEPATMALLAIGALSLLRRRRG